MKRWRWAVSVQLAAALAACGGGGGSSDTFGSSTGVTSPTPTPGPTTVAGGCTLRERQDWAAAQLREWYLFPETLPAGLSPAGYTTVQAYLDALTATARSQRKDRYFTYIASIAEENAFQSSGATAGFGFRISTAQNGTRLTVSEAFEGAPALAAGIDRGAQILAIGSSASSLRNVTDIVSVDGSNGVSSALGPNTPGTTRAFRISDAAGERVVTVAKADYSLSAISPRYGAKVIEEGGERIGYLNYRTFIEASEPGLRQAFASFRQQGVTKVIVDFRYNGGGRINIAYLLADLLGGNRSTGDVLGYVSFRPEKASENTTRFYSPQPQSITPTRIAFIGTAATASASELVIAASVPYLRANAALIGANTYGKPVGQIGLDRAQCDDRLRPVALATQNAERRGDYYSGLAATVEASCEAADDLSRPLGDPQEASVRAALDYLAGRPCTRISTDAVAQSASAAARRTTLLSPERPDTAQREVPGLF